MDCYPYPDMMTDMIPQVEVVRAIEDRGPMVIVFVDLEGNWTMAAINENSEACILATGTKWMMGRHAPE